MEKGHSYKEHLSYVLARLEDIKETQDKVEIALKEHMKEEEKIRKEGNEKMKTRFTRVEERLDSIEKNISISKTVVRTIKTIGILILTIFTLNLENVKEIWKDLINLFNYTQN